MTLITVRKFMEVTILSTIFCRSLMPAAADPIVIAATPNYDGNARSRERYVNPVS